MRDLAPEAVYKYACEDADVTLKLKQVLENELETNEVKKLFEEIEMPLVPVLAYMERNGVRIDTDALKENLTAFYSPDEPDRGRGTPAGRNGVQHCLSQTGG